MVNDVGDTIDSFKQVDLDEMYKLSPLEVHLNT